MAVPLTVLLKMILESYPETRSFAMIIGSVEEEPDVEQI